MIPLVSDPAHHTMVTTHDGRGAPLGTVAASAGAVSLTPPLVLACVDEGSATLAAILHNRRFALNVLPGPAAGAGAALDGGVAEYLDDLSIQTLGGLPIVGDATASLRCELHDVADGGPLTVMVGHVVGLDQRSGITA